jgi:arylsulfatase A-like enzyme
MTHRLLTQIRRAIVAGAAATVFSSLASASLLTFLSGGGRIRQSGYFLLGAIPIQMGRNIYRDLPYEVSAYRAVAGVADWFQFTSDIFWAQSVINLALVSAAVLLGNCIKPIRRLLDHDLLVRAGVFFSIVYPVIYVAVRAALSDVVRDVTVRSLVAVVVALMLTYGPLLLSMNRTAAAWCEPALRRIIRIGLSAGALLLLTTATLHLRTASAVVQATGPNVLLISIDSLRADHLSGYGYDRQTSPRIDELAQQGVRFSSAVTSSPWTLPSHMSLFTGLDALSHGVWQHNRRLASDVPTLTQALKASGYETGGVVAGPFLSASWGFGRGFDFYDDFSVGRLGGGADHRQITSPRVLDAAARWIGQWNDGARAKPFFLFVHFWDVHYDYRPPVPYDRAFETGYAGPITPVGYERNREIQKGMDPAALAFIESQYDGEILFTDDHVGRLLDALDALEVLDQTLVVVTADHGEEFFEHGRKGHRRGLYDEVMLVPLIMRWPSRIPAKTVVEAPVRLIDVAPTILEYVGVDSAALGDPGPPLYSARDLSPLIADPNHEEMPRLAFMDLHGGQRQGIRTGDRKFIAEPKGIAELYDIHGDSGELDNLADDQPDERANFRRLLRGWVESRKSTLVGESSQTEEQMEILRSLGYIQ